MEKEHTTEPATTCMNLKNLKMQPDAHEEKICVITCTWNIQKRQSCRDKKWINGCLSLSMELGIKTAKEHKENFGNNKDVWKLDYGAGCMTL